MDLGKDVGSPASQLSFYKIWFPSEEKAPGPEATGRWDAREGSEVMVLSGGRG